MKTGPKACACRLRPAILRGARERAKAAGAKNIEERPIPSAPVEALVGLAKVAKADLLIVGRVGLDPIIGRLFSVLAGSGLKGSALARESGRARRAG